MENEDNTAELDERRLKAAAAVDEVLARQPANRTLLDKWKFIMGAIADPELSSNAKAMLPVIVDEFRQEAGYARRGYQFLAQKAGMSERTGRRAVEDLVEAGYVEKKVDRRGSASEVNQYQPTWTPERQEAAKHAEATRREAARLAREAASKNKPAKAANPKGADVRPESATPNAPDVWPDLATGGRHGWPQGEAPVANNILLGSSDSVYGGERIQIEEKENSSERGARAPASPHAGRPALPSAGMDGTKASGSSRRKKQPAKTSLPADWTPNDEAVEFAKAQRGDKHEATLARFVHHFAVENTEREFVDWNARYRQWVEEDASKSRSHSRGEPMPDKWEPSKEIIEKAYNIPHIPLNDMRAETDKFILKHTVGRGCSVKAVDWNEVWYEEMQRLAEKESNIKRKYGKPRNRANMTVAL